MKIIALRFLLLSILGIALAGCAPTMYVQTGGSSSSVLNRSAPHFIMPPTATDSAEVNLYPLVVNAFEKNHITLTQSKNEATYLVTWGTESQSKQMRTIEAMNSSPDWNSNLNLNSYSYYAPSGLAATGPQYTTVIRSYRMQNFTINVWKKEASGSHTSSPLWSGSATAGSSDVKNPATIIDDIVARYGTTFEGKSPIRNN